MYQGGVYGILSGAMGLLVRRLQFELISPTPCVRAFYHQNLFFPKRYFLSQPPHPGYHNYFSIQTQ